MATMSIQDLIAGKQKDMAAKKSRQNTLKPAPGKHTYRILPSWRGGDDKQFWHDFGMHFIKTRESGTKPAAVYVCSEKTFGKPCEVCSSVEKLMAVSTDDDMTQMLKEAKSAQRYLMNVIHLTGPEPTKSQIMECGNGVFEAVCNLIEEYGDITDPTEGIDIIITRTGAGLETKYTVMPAAKSQPANTKALGEMANLDDFVSQENPAGETKALTAVGVIVGLLPSASSAPKGKGHAALADLSSAADSDDAAPVGRSKPVVDDELDDLDALLAADD